MLAKNGATVAASEIVAAAELSEGQSSMPAYPFAWAGVYECPAGEYALELMFGKSPTLSLVMLRIGSSAGLFFKQLAGHAADLFATSAVDRRAGHVVLPGALHQRLVLERQGLTRFPVLLPTAGRYAVFTNRHPAAFAMCFTGLTLVSERLFALCVAK